MAGASVATLVAVAAAAAAGFGVAVPAGRLAGGSPTAKRLTRAACVRVCVRCEARRGESGSVLVAGSGSGSRARACGPAGPRTRVLDFENAGVSHSATARRLNGNGGCWASYAIVRAGRVLAFLAACLCLLWHPVLCCLLLHLRRKVPGQGHRVRRWTVARDDRGPLRARKLFAIISPPHPQRPAPPLAHFGVRCKKICRSSWSAPSNVTSGSWRA